MAAKENEKEVGVDRMLSAGSALILAVVLTSLLAMVGVLFVLAARVDSIGTSAVSDNSDLGRAVDTVIVRISEELAIDVPGVLLDDMNVPTEEYYDYADLSNAWLANLEPYEIAPPEGVRACIWGQISDVTGYLARRGWTVQDIDAFIDGGPLIADHSTLLLDADGQLVEQLADADGDGVSDSKWVLLEGMSSSKGRPIFIAVRIVDNGGMLNVNSGYEFNPLATDANFIDGSALTQINLMNIYKGVEDDPRNILRFRCDGLEPDLLTYNYEYAIRPQNPDRRVVNYLPFDISDELDLRNRFLLDMWHNSARIEAAVSHTLPYYNGNPYRHRYVPIDTLSEFDKWEEMLNALDPDEDYDFRHVLTTYNMDRIMAPDGGPMINVNRIYDVSEVSDLFMAVRQVLIDAGFQNDPMAAQIAVNIKDYVDTDDEVTGYAGAGEPYYGFVSPCVYISELGLKYAPDVNDTNIFDKSYAVELYKPYAQDGNPVGWKLKIDNGTPKPINWPAAGQFQVTYWNNPMASFVDSNTVSTCDPNCDPNTDPNCDPNCDPNSSSTVISITRDTFVFDACSVITLLRPVSGGGDVVVDGVVVPSWFQGVGGAGELSFQRDIGLHKCIKRLWDTTGSRALTLDAVNDYNLPDELPIQAHPADAPLRNIGELGMVFRRPAYYVLGSEAPEDLLVVPIGYSANANTEEAVRIDLGDPNFQPILNYLTVFDPRTDGVDNDGDGVGFDKNDNGLADANEIDVDEVKIAGRININTAPWFVIAQLPWMRNEIAQAVVAYRDRIREVPGIVDYSNGRARGMWNTTDPSPPIYVREEPGFASVGELVNVTHDLAGMGGGSYMELFDIRRYGRNRDVGNNDIDELRFPDLTPPSQTEGDGAANDFEERDLIFARISNLVTVRSDVFTAYIVVRIGADGPQKRVVAVLDRSNVYPNGAGGFNGRVKIRAVHPVPDPR